MEKVAAHEIDENDELLSKQNILRYNSIKKCKTDDYESKNYVVSTILAELLYYRYCNGDDSYKKHIIGEIQKILSGNLVLEDMLINEGISIDDDNLPQIIRETIEKSKEKVK